MQILYLCVLHVEQLMQWVELLKRSYGPSQPESLRQVVASALHHSWRSLIHHSDNDHKVITEFWLLLVELLQDYNVSCRNVAAKCVADIQASTDGR